MNSLKKLFSLVWKCTQVASMAMQVVDFINRFPMAVRITLVVIMLVVALLLWAYRSHS